MKYMYTEDTDLPTGINSYKVFMAYKDVMMLEDPDIFKCFRVCRALRALPMVHAENGHLIAIVSIATFV